MMKLIFLIVLALHSFLEVVSMDMKQCKGQELEVGEDKMLHVTDCAKEGGFEGKDLKEIPPEKLPCLAKCVFMKTGLIDEKGMPHKENLVNMVKSQLPEAVHKDLEEKMDKCISPKSMEMIDPEDKTCATYVQVFTCIYFAFIEVCAD